MHKILTAFAGHEICFFAEDGLFSPAAPDRGTLAMLRHVGFSPDMKLLDLGCSWGYVGILAALVAAPGNIYMADIDPVAVSRARANAEANGIYGINFCTGDAYDGVDASGFDLILSNPPYHADFSVPSRFITKGFNRLAIGGRLVMVTKRRDWYENRLRSVFGGVQVVEDDGYFVFIAQRRGYSRADAKKKS